MPTGPPALEPMLELRGITVRFGATLANEAVDLTVRAGEIVALLGENGAGKTTLMNVLFGLYRADAGSVRVAGTELVGHSPRDALAAGVGMVHQHFTLAGAASVLDNVVLGTESLWRPVSGRRAARARLERLVADTGLAVPLDARVSELAVGQRQRVEILKALYRDVRVLVLDEPTAVLTPQEADDLFARLRAMAGNGAADGLAVVVISHKLHEVMAVSDRVVVLRRGRVVGSAVTADVDRATLAAMIVGREVERPVAVPRAPGEIVLEVRDVDVAGARGARKRLDGASLAVRSGEIVGVAGVSGNGQDVLAAVLSGLQRVRAGTVRVLGADVDGGDARVLVRLGVARVPEDRQRHGSVGELSLWENLLLDDIGTGEAWRGGFVLDRRAARARAQALVHRFDVRADGIERPAALLSGGNLQKLILARELSRAPRLILANQPARGLDEGAVAAVHALLLEARDAGAGVLLITEDLDELLRLADTVVVMHEGRTSEPLPAAGLDVRELGLRMAGSSGAGPDGAGSSAAKSAVAKVA